MTRWLWSTQRKSQLAKIGGHCPSKGRDKAFFEKSRDHMINGSRDSVGKISSTYKSNRTQRQKRYIYYKLGQACVTNWGSFVLLQIRADVVTNRDSFIITNWASVVTNWDSYYKLEQPLLQNRAAITNWDKIYYKLGQVLQIRAIITNWSITTCN